MTQRTFKRLYDSEFARSGSASRANSSAGARMAFLLATAAGAADQYSTRTAKRHKRVLRDAGLAPCKNASALSDLVRDLDLDHAEDLVRLLRMLNSDRSRSWDRVVARWSPMIEEAMRLASAEGPRIDEHRHAA